jgi:hypothetical protein
MIAGVCEETLAVQVFRIREHLRDASTMYYDGWSAGGRRFDALDCAQVRVGAEWWKQIEPVAHRGGQDRSESGPESQALDELKRREQHSKPRGIGKDRGHGASLDSFDQAATMITLDE